MRKLRTIAVIAMALAIVFATAGCNQNPIPVIPPTVDPTPNPGPNPDGGGETTTPTPLPTESQSEVQDAIKAVFAALSEATDTTGEQSWSNDDFEGKYTYTVNDGWTLHAWGNRKTTKVSSYSSAKASSNDIEFIITSDDVTSGKTIEVTLDGKEYTTSATAITSTVAFKWEIDARSAKHTDGFTGYVNNNEKVSSVVYENGTITITGDITSMTPYTSTNPNQNDAPYKWIALLIRTGEDNLTKVLYNGSALTNTDISNREAMSGTDNTPAESDEFVLWLKADPNITSYITLGHAGVADQEIKITFTNTGSIDDPEESGDPEESQPVTGDDEEESQTPGIVVVPGGDEDEKDEVSPGGSTEEGEGSNEQDPVL